MIKKNQKETGAPPRGQSVFLKKSAAVILSISQMLMGTPSYPAEIQKITLLKPPGIQVELKIPEKLGTLEEFYPSQCQGAQSKADCSSKTVIYIQDAHDSLEAQENISKLIHLLVANYGVKTVLEEGYEGPVPTDQYFGKIKDPEVREKVAYFLMDKLRLGGAEYAHITRFNSVARLPSFGASKKESFLRGSRDERHDFKLVGADSLLLHRENIEHYQASEKHRKATEEDLQAMDAEIRKLTQRYFTRELRDWMELKEKLDRKELDLLDYLKRTQSLFLKGIGFEEFRTAYPNTALLLSAAETKDEKLLTKLKASVDHRAIFQEMNRLEDDYAETHLTQDRDRQVFHYYKLIQLLKRLNHIEVTEEEYAAVKDMLPLPNLPRRVRGWDQGSSSRELSSEKDGPFSSKMGEGYKKNSFSPAERGGLRGGETSQIADFIAAQTRQSLVLSKLWEKNIQSAIDFYEVARERDGSIQSRLKHYAASDDFSPIILVYGGFHKGRVKELLEQNGFSYAVVSPKITSMSSKHRDYYRQLMSMGYNSMALPKLVATASSPPRLFDSAALSSTHEGDLLKQLSLLAGIAARDTSKNLTLTLRSMDLALSRSEVRTAIPKKIKYPNITVRGSNIGASGTGRAAIQKPDGTVPGENFKNWVDREVEIEREMVVKALTRAKGNRVRAAKLLGINRESLYRKMKAHNISIPRIYSSADAVSVIDAELNLEAAKESALKQAIVEALAITDGVKVKAALLLGVNRITLDRDILRLKIVYTSDTPKDGRWPVWNQRQREYVARVILWADGNQRQAAETLGWSSTKLSRYLQREAPTFELLKMDLDKEHRLKKPLSLDEVQRAYLISALIFFDFNQSKAAKQVGVSKRTLTSWLKRLNVPSALPGAMSDRLINYAAEIKQTLNPEELAEFLYQSRNRLQFESDLAGLKKVFDAQTLKLLYQEARENQAAAVDAAQKTMEGQQVLKRKEDFPAMTAGLKQKLLTGSSLDSLLPEAFAVFKEASKFQIQKEPSREQILAGIAIHQGAAVEMEPSEGKTLSIALAAYLNALTGKGVHIHTFNNYLTIRDSQDMGAVFSLLGMTVGVRIDGETSYLYDSEASSFRKPGFSHLARNKKNAQGKKKIVVHHDAYQNDITYGVKEQFVFDFLNDQSGLTNNSLIQRKETPALTVVDEGDSVMLDEAYEPLILANPVEAGGDDLNEQDYRRIYSAVLSLQPREDYEMDTLNEDVRVRDEAIAKIYENLLGGAIAAIKLERFYATNELKNIVRQALLVKHFNQRDSDYILQGGRVVLVDEFTGRLKKDHVLGNHRHQFIAAKETLSGNKVRLDSETRIMGIMTYQNYYRMIRKTSTLAMITGTMGNDAAEINDSYNLHGVKIPLQFKSRLVEHSPVITATKEEKDVLMIEKIKEIHAKGNPVLIFVRRISDARQLQELMAKSARLSADVIDGLHLTKELELISKAGQRGQITIATNVVGRGVNIETGADVDQLGGLVVMMTRKNKSRRIDLQSLLRTARRGKAGEVYWFLSREDESERRFGAQEHSEEFLRQLRAKTLYYDDVIDEYRQFFYQARRRLLELVSSKGIMIRRGIFFKVDQVWQNYLQELQFYKYRDTTDNYAKVSRVRMQQVRQALRLAFEKEHKTEALESIEASYD